MQRQVRVGVIGATGYSGLELLRLLAGHPGAELTYVAASRDAPAALAAEEPFLRGLGQLQVAAYQPDACALACDFVFVALPSGSSGAVAAELVERGLKVIDLSGDLRLPADVYEAWYGRTAPVAAALELAVYGLTEWRRRQVVGAVLVANPGCYATAALLALLPLAQAGILSPASPVVVDAKSGVSGAGRKAGQNALLGELADNFYAYKVGRHQHTPEIEQQLSAGTDTGLRVLLTTQLLPAVRGIYVSAYVTPAPGGRGTLGITDYYQVYQEAYEQEPFVRLLPLSSLPQLKHVRGSNYCDIGLHLDDRTGLLQVFSVIDNLQKGAAGQAVQNFNVMNGLVETDGLLAQPLYP